jgi:hypothetical protein
MATRPEEGVDGVEGDGTGGGLVLDADPRNES